MTTTHPTLADAARALVNKMSNRCIEMDDVRMERNAVLSALADITFPIPPAADPRDAEILRLREAVGDLLDIVHDDLTHVRQKDHAEAINRARKLTEK